MKKFLIALAILFGTVPAYAGNFGIEYVRFRGGIGFSGIKNLEQCMLLAGKLHAANSTGEKKCIDIDNTTVYRIECTDPTGMFSTKRKPIKCRVTETF